MIAPFWLSVRLNAARFSASSEGVVAPRISSTALKVPAGAGWALGANWERFHHAFHYVDYAVLGLVVIAAVVLGLRWRSSRLARRAAADSAR